MKKVLIRLVTTLGLTIFAIALFGAINAYQGAENPSAVEAASAKKKAMKAYKKMLAKSVLKTKVEGTPKIKTKKLEFGIAYIDNNSVPELVVRRIDREGFYMGCDILVYTYYKGKVRQLTFAFGSRGIQDEGDNPAYQKPRYYKKTGILFASEQYGEQYFWKLSKGKIKSCSLWYLHNEFSDDGENEYYDDGEKISEETYNHLKRKLTKKKKASYFKFRKNTSKNRKKYLK